MMETRDLLEIGRSLVGAGRYGEAIRIYRKVIQREPDHVHSLDVLGFLYYMTNDFETALQMCERSLAVDADSFYAQKGYGLCLVKAGRIEDGLAALHRSIELNPDYYDSRHDLGVTLLELERWDEARDAFEGARRVEPGRAGEIDQALKTLANRRAASKNS